MKILLYKVNTALLKYPIFEINAVTLVSMIVWTLAQHESAVIGWYTLLLPYFQHWLSTAAAVFIIVSIIDLFWLYCLFYLFKKSFHGLVKLYRVRVWLDRIQHKPWFQRIKKYFSESPSEEEILHVQPHDSRFKRFIKRSGHLGIVIIAAIPSPGLKEVGIIMALTPKYKRHGFWLMYIGGIIKTTGTLLVYGGLYKAFHQLFQQTFF